MYCTMDQDINSCPYYNKLTNSCFYDKKCSFQKVEELTQKYIRKERWYEKYYKNKEK